MYKVIMFYRGKSKRELACFHKLPDARLFVSARLEWDESIQSMPTIYEIYEDDALVQQSEWNAETSQPASFAKFNPTPMPTAPRPPGGPPASVFEDE